MEAMWWSITMVTWFLRIILTPNRWYFRALINSLFTPIRYRQRLKVISSTTQLPARMHPTTSQLYRLICRLWHMQVRFLCPITTRGRSVLAWILKVSTSSIIGTISHYGILDLLEGQLRCRTTGAWQLDSKRTNTTISCTRQATIRSRWTPMTTWSTIA